MRVFFHVQWLLGIGHLQRSLRIAESLVGKGAEVTLALGGPAAPGVAIDPAIRTVRLPPIRALDAGFVLVDERGEAICDEFRSVRRARLLAAFAEEQPDVVVIEGFPFARRAFAFELDPLVAAARAAGARVACSVRDVIVMRDDPKRHRAAIERVRQGFDTVMVHGDPDFIPFSSSFPPAAEIADRLVYTGYVVEPERPDSDGPAGEVVVSAGGGKAGATLMRAALEARLSGCLADAPWRLLTGMNVDDGEFAQLCAAAPSGVAVERFRGDFPALLRRCRVSVSQCGYNTALDIVGARAPAVLVPFAGGHETEQLTRAQHLSARGAAVLVRDDELTPARLAAAIESAASQPPKPLEIDTRGARRSAEIIATLASPGGRGMIVR
ncbi:MAG TPA: glycosyltransferase [Stellaceae bacterium]